MDTTMMDIGRQKSESRKRQIKIYAAALMGLIPAVTFFLPYVEYMFRDSHFSLSAYQVMFSAGIRFQEYLITIPLIARIAVGAGVVLSLLAIVLLFLKRPGLSGTGFVLSAVTPMVVLTSSSSIQTAVTSLSVSNIVISYRWPFVLTMVLGLCAAILAQWTRGGEKLAESIFKVFACVSVGSVVVITIYMIVSGAPAIAEIGLGNFLFGAHWEPKNGLYGILPLILSSIVGTLGAIVIGVPIGILTAIFLSETAPNWVANVVRPAVQLLAGIPSVVYGFFGMLIIVPAIRGLFPGQTIGDSLLAVIVILAIMVLPTIVSVSETALRAVPVSYREASLALGTTPVKTIFKVTVPAAKSGILAGVILGVGRAIGETMAVIMVAGNVVNMPSILGTVRLMTTGIVMEMSYSSGLHRQALFAIGLVLFVFIMIVNLSFTYLSRKGVQLSRD